MRTDSTQPLLLDGTPPPRRASRARDVLRRSRARTGAVLRRTHPEVYDAVCDALRAGALPSDIARECGVSRHVVSGIRRDLYSSEQVVAVRALAARAARQAQGSALAELQRRLDTSPARLGARDLVAAARVLGESARADEGSAPPPSAPPDTSDVTELLVVYARGRRTADGFGGNGAGLARPQAAAALEADVRDLGSAPVPAELPAPRIELSLPPRPAPIGVSAAPATDPILASVAVASTQCESVGDGGLTP